MSSLRALLFGFLITTTSFAIQAETDIGKSLNDKMDAATLDLENNKNVGKAWQLMTEVAAIVKHNPSYDDGEYVESMSSLTVNLLSHSWKAAEPYLTSPQSSPAFREFILNHVNELSTAKDLNDVKKNVSRHCNLKEVAYCREIISKINRITQIGG